MPDKCIIFDLDDTLVDSEELCIRAFYNLVPELKENFENFLEKNRGIKLALIFEDIESLIKRKLSTDFEARYRYEVKRLFDLYLKPNKGGRAALNTLGYPMCVASSGPKLKIEHALRVTNLRKFFGDNLFSSYEVGAWKPDPGLFLFAAEKMGFSPENCVVIEDSTPGVMAARAANMRVFKYSKHSTGDNEGEVIVFNDMQELSKLIDRI